MKNKKGFTLVELLIVIAIIAIIAGIILGSMAEARAKGRDASKIRSMDEIRKALNLYQAQYDGFPLTLNDLVTAGIIVSVNSSIDYIPLAPSTMTSPTTCPNYHLGTSLEKNNAVLATDKDFTSPLIGVLPRCYAGAGAGITGADTGKCRVGDVDGAYCYDLTP